VSDGATDERFMRLAMANAHTVRLSTRPNPWVGCVVVADNGEVFQGATSEPGGPHAEIHALRHATERPSARRCTRRSNRARTPGVRLRVSTR